VVGSPAARAGIKPGDRISRSTAHRGSPGMNCSPRNSGLSGAAGTHVAVKLKDRTRLGPRAAITLGTLGKDHHLRCGRASPANVSSSA
jgi:hypothetical protein